MGAESSHSASIPGPVAFREVLLSLAGVPAFEARFLNRLGRFLRSDARLVGRIPKKKKDGRSLRARRRPRHLVAHLSPAFALGQGCFVDHDWRTSYSPVPHSCSTVGHSWRPRNVAFDSANALAATGAAKALITASGIAGAARGHCRSDRRPMTVSVAVG